MKKSLFLVMLFSFISGSTLKGVIAFAGKPKKLHISKNDANALKKLKDGQEHLLQYRIDSDEEQYETVFVAQPLEDLTQGYTRRDYIAHIDFLTMVRITLQEHTGNPPENKIQTELTTAGIPFVLVAITACLASVGIVTKFFEK